MEQNTSVCLGNYFDNFVKTNISEGRYGNVNEIICAGLRLLEEEENQIKVLKRFLQEGIDSGIAENFNPKKHLESLKAKKRND
jgi:antitoxin ParD1/3/4